MSLAEFLLARITEDEARRWYAHDAECDAWAESSSGSPLDQVLADMTISARCDCPVPARTLAECDAKRRIVELHHRVDSEEWRPDDWPPSPECAGCGFNAVEEYRTPDVDECPELRILAAVYADHPDYRLKDAP
jgi:hypothetical protein